MAIADRMNIGIASPHIFTDGNVDMTFAASYVRRAEELGYASLWTQERVTGSPTVLHPLTFLAWLAGQTSTARIGVSVLVLPRHNPVMLAKLAADIDVMSGGRLVLGVGLGNNGDELPMYGITAERRVTRVVEQVQAVRALWGQSPSGHSGTFYDLPDASISPRPAGPPIIFGANADAALARSVRHADGWMGAGSGPLDDFPRKVALVKSYLAEAGRDTASFPISKRLYLAVDDDEERALRRLREWFGYYYGNPGNAEHAAIWGSAAKIGELLEEWTEMGVDEVLLNPVFDMEEHLERLADITGLG
ncbi:MAG: LLM class flavin-dependent oxidoreductase [Chloroflexi bacterium]|nr:LLM class flavin-dependent oxidoreductase [Chloroflexota bacterium]